MIIFFNVLTGDLALQEDDLNAAIANMSNDDIRATIRALENEIRIMNSDVNRIRYESEQQKAHVKDNKEKIKLNKQ